MLRKIIIILTLSVFVCGQLSAHSGKPKYHVIIDTDGALDDMRSISMFLSGNDIRVLAITCSQGTLLPDSVYTKIRSLLSVFHHEGIKVGVGDKTEQELPSWSSFTRGIPWGNPAEKTASEKKEEATILLNRVTENYRDKIILIALGSLKTYADWIKSNPKAVEKVDKIIWYNKPVIEKGFNYEASPESYNYISQSGIDLVVVNNISGKFSIDETYLSLIKNSNSIYARQLFKVLTLPDVKKRKQESRLQLYDDMVPLYLTVPILFDIEEREGVKFATLNKSIPESFIYETIGTILESASTTNNRVFNAFPVDKELYKPEYSKILNSTIEKFGLIEWKAISMTNEIHGHTGIYSIIGAKMGVRAMEFYNVGVNNLTVTTFAGNKPPLSCFNDGIQISTGATIGQGLITITDSVSVVPSAIFEFNGQRVKISLKPEIAAQMQKEIAWGVQTYGLLTDQYWLYIEELAIGYWDIYSRFEIFDFVVLS